MARTIVIVIVARRTKVAVIVIVLRVVVNVDAARQCVGAMRSESASEVY